MNNRVIRFLMEVLSIDDGVNEGILPKLVSSNSEAID